MERELWLALYTLTCQCDSSPWWALTRYDDAEIVGVYLWAVVHDRPTSWACDPRNWPQGLWHRKLPSQATMSRRLRTAEVQALLRCLECRLARLSSGGFTTLLDGKPLLVGTHSKDPEARWGRVRRGWAKGYKLHAAYGAGNLPDAWEVEPLNEAEPEIAAQLVPRLRAGGGYLLGDSIYDSNPLHDVAMSKGYQLVAQRKRPESGLGHRRHSPGRLRSIALLTQQFGKDLYAHREHIERQFAWLTNHAGGLSPLPNWVRRLSRVRQWVQAKLLIHVAYVHLKHPRPLPAGA